jgi:hypothetical protein
MPGQINRAGDRTKHKPAKGWFFIVWVANKKGVVKKKNAKGE